MLHEKMLICWENVEEVFDNCRRLPIRRLSCSCTREGPTEGSTVCDEALLGGGSVPCC